MNLAQFTFLFFALFVGSLGLLIVLIEPYVPVIIKRTFKFGKFAEKVEHPFVIKLEVPKRWFSHFYVFAAPFSILLLLIAVNRYFYNGNVPEVLHQVLDGLLGPRRQPLVSPECTLLSLILITIHCNKRLYEATCVSIFSDARLNILHYIAGFAHYAGTLLSIIGESEGFVRGTSANFNWNNITTTQIVISVIFLFSTYMQLRSNYILANLRKKKDAINSYKIPRGELFEYVSSPLQFTEIILYTCLILILRSSATFYFVYLWVFINQASCAVLAQDWYHKTFKNYPTSRRIVFPYLF